MYIPNNSALLPFFNINIANEILYTYEACATLQENIFKDKATKKRVLITEIVTCKTDADELTI